MGDSIKSTLLILYVVRMTRLSSNLDPVFSSTNNKTVTSNYLNDSTAMSEHYYNDISTENVPNITRYDIDNETVDSTNYSTNSVSGVYFHDDVADAIWKYISPVLIIIGTVGNIISVIVLTRKTMGKLSSSPYLVVLGVVDVFVLNIGLLRQWIRVVTEVDVRDLSEAGCKIHIFLVYLSLQYSIWILVSVTVERFISVCFPFKAKIICTRRNSIVLLSFICGVFVLLNTHMLFGYGHVHARRSDNTTVILCIGVNEDYRRFWNFQWSLIYFSNFSIIPFAVIICCNICIVAKVLISRKRNKVGVSRSSKIEDHRDVKVTHMTRLLLILNTTFLINTTPISIYMIYGPFWVENITDEGFATLQMFFAIASMFMYLNNSINFLMYCVSAPRFRRELKQLFGHRATVGVREFTSTHTFMASRARKTHDAESTV